MIISMIANPVYILRMGLIPTEVQQELVPGSTTMGYACLYERGLLFISYLYWSHIPATRIWVPTVGVRTCLSEEVTCV